ncbi:MAG: ribonuclease D [Nocardioidaceae bacterium]|nr:ribonuclease D [Nocardioidaceae bacterium]
MDPASPGAEGPDVGSPETELALLELRDGLPVVVDSPHGLEDSIAAFAAGRGPVAVDAERASGHRYSQRAYLLQLRREGAGTTLIDPVPFGEVPNRALKPLAEAIADAEWIIHAASQDLPCLAQLGMRPAHLFDTELAGRLLGYPRVGLAVLVEELLGWRMRKEHSAVDWSRRPLPDPWLLYAALDVEVLIELRNVLADQLVAAGKAEWAAQEFAAWTALTVAPPREEPWRRTSGIHRVRGRRGLALVRAIWQLRDELAQRRDVTSTWILPDSAIVDAAVAAPPSRNALSRLPGFATRGAQRYLREFAAAIAAALDLHERELPSLAPRLDGPPPPRAWAEKDPVAAARLHRCRAAINEIAAQRELPQENLLAPDVVRRLAWSPPEPGNVLAVTATLEGLGARPWQVELTASTLADALVDSSADRAFRER